MQANDLNQLFEAYKNAPSEEAEAETVDRAVRQLSDAQREKLNGILSSPEKIKELMRSDTAQSLLKKLGKQGK